MEINIRGLFLRMGYEIQQMLSQESGVIVNNSSLAGFVWTARRLSLQRK